MWDRVVRSTSRSFCLLAACVSIGATISLFIQVFFLHAALACVFTLALAALARDRSTRIIALALCAFAFGLFRGAEANAPLPSPSVGDFFGREIRIEGTVAGLPTRKLAGTDLVLSDLRFADEPASGKLLVRVDEAAIEPGDVLAFRCAISDPRDIAEGYASLLASRGVRGVCFRPASVDVRAEATVWSPLRVASRVRDACSEALNRALPEPNSSFVSGLMFGGSDLLPINTRDAFRNAGLSHILSASGYNLSLFTVSFLAFAKRRLGRRRGLLLTAILASMFVLAAGAPPAVLRAGVMAALILAADASRRSAHPAPLILATLALLLAVNPLLVADPGFQLSFVATAALLAYASPLAKRMEFVPESLGLRETLAASLVAGIFTAPIQLWHFGTLSLVAPVANLFVLPFLPSLMAAGLAAIPFGLVLPALAPLAGLPAWGSSTLVLELVRVFSAIPFALTEPAHAQLFALLFAGLLAYFLWNARRHASA